MLMLKNLYARASKRDLVLGSGGIKGFAHIGFLKAILERGLPIGNVVGVSIGSVVATMFANGFTPDQIRDLLLDEINKVDTGELLQMRTLLKPLKIWNAGGVINLYRLMTDGVKRFNLRPQPNLKIVAYNFKAKKPVVFEGTDYDLGTAVAASCAVPFVMRSIRMAGGVNLVDGGVFHPSPVKFCQNPAVVSRLGLARYLPKHRLGVLEFLMHVGEMLFAPVHDRLFVEGRAPNLVINSGKPDVATLTFGMQAKDCLAMIDYAYEQTGRALDSAAVRGMFS